MYLKIYKNGEHVLIAACDKEVLGKKLKHGNTIVEISKAFYGGNMSPRKNSKMLFRELRLQISLGKKQSSVP